MSYCCNVINYSGDVFEMKSLNKICQEVILFDSSIRDETNGHCAICGTFIGIEKAKLDLCSDCKEENKNDRP